MGRETMAESVAACCLGDSSSTNGDLDRVLGIFLGNMMPSEGMGWVNGESLEAAGYLRFNAKGKKTAPPPRPRSCRWVWRTRARWTWRGDFSLAGRMVRRSRIPFPARTLIWL